MTLTKSFLSGTLIASFLIAANVFAQVSSVEGIKPVEGVDIPKAKSVLLWKPPPGAITKDCDECRRSSWGYFVSITMCRAHTSAVHPDADKGGSGRAWAG